jgi:hypothetical protein
MDLSDLAKQVARLSLGKRLPEGSTTASTGDGEEGGDDPQGQG